MGAAHVKDGFTVKAGLEGRFDTYWTTEDGQESAVITLKWDIPQTFSIIELREQIAVGQRIEKFQVDAWVKGAWKTIAEGGTVGYKRLLRCKETTTEKVRIVIEESRVAPTLDGIGVY